MKKQIGEESRKQKQKRDWRRQKWKAREEKYIERHSHQKVTTCLSTGSQEIYKEVAKKEISIIKCNKETVQINTEDANPKKPGMI